MWTIYNSFLNLNVVIVSYRSENINGEMQQKKKLKQLTLILKAQWLLFFLSQMNSVFDHNISGQKMKQQQHHQDRKKKQIRFGKKENAKT